MDLRPSRPIRSLLVRQDDRTKARARSFGAIAADYDRFRPAPPDDALDWALPSDARDVVELGAGTGLLTRKLLARVRNVVAVEPDPRMREVLSQRTAGADVRAGQAEQIAMPDSSADAVIASSAWHWVDEQRAVPEVARILRPGGFFSLLWNGPDRRVDWMRALWAGGQLLSEQDANSLDAARRDRHLVDLGGTGAFAEPEVRRFEWTSPMSRQDLVGLAGTYSAVITMEEVDRRRYLDSVEEFLHSREEFFGLDKIPVPMRCQCWRAVRQ
jgi:SAM-dependent methyltransferase